MPSYSPVFSVPFIINNNLAPNTSFEVPTGYTAVIRQITCAQNVGDFIFYLTIQDSEAAPSVTVVLLQSLDVINYADWTGRIVVVEGGIMNIGYTVVGDDFSAYVGGYLLRNTLS